MINHILELEISWGMGKISGHFDDWILDTHGLSWEEFSKGCVETGSFICEDFICEDCEFRFACYTTSDVVIELERSFTNYHNAMRYRNGLRKRFPRSRLYD